jgi:bifunctional UDP-N-acetylglucosamine pyrophosphorylase/glucosamine-1-phosphate N-acetyltransferase
MEHQLAVLKRAGLEDVTVVASQANEAEVRRLLPDRPVAVQADDGRLGTRGALLAALPQVTDDWVLVVAGTDLVDAGAYAAVLEAAAKPGTDGVFLGKRMTTHFPGGYLTVEKDGRIVSIVEKPKPGEEPSDLVNIVIHAHKRQALLEALRAVPDSAGDGYSEVEKKLMAEGRYVLAAYEGEWYAFKYAWDPVKALPLFLRAVGEQTIHPQAKIHPTAVLEGPVLIEEGVTVMAGAVVSGPAYLGARTTVGYGAIVRGGSYGHDCVIGSGCEVKNSVFAPHVWTHGSYVGDSVLAENVSLGNGCTLGNLRLDEAEVTSTVRGTKLPTGLRKFGAAIGEGCRLGFGVGTSPGVKIGRDSFVGSHALLTQDVPDRTFIHVKNGALEVRENRTVAPHPAEGPRGEWKGQFTK